jgi:hypothetical protein
MTEEKENRDAPAAHGNPNYALTTSGKCHLMPLDDLVEQGSCCVHCGQENKKACKIKHDDTFKPYKRPKGQYTEVNNSAPQTVGLDIKKTYHPIYLIRRWAVILLLLITFWKMRILLSPWIPALLGA